MQKKIQNNAYNNTKQYATITYDFQDNKLVYSDIGRPKRQANVLSS